MAPIGYAGSPIATTNQLAGAQLKRTGSLADACSMLNAEVEALESAMKTLYERSTPFLEQAVPSPNASQATEGRAASPLAESIFEYVGRIRRQREGIEELTSRISY